ncbi:head decoration protein [Thiocystis violascens]|uniref:Head decoration protein n=1 Tax=Thiocystis violascens (strain ATCC 17096 / DSM 198 / 6111) TaxID=765911 RepID=I3YEH9_THIV6|nr:head decoration protein [Thiocystis violascens]AFL75397.1 hypothetical protein Thivi_3530 [Thiocystis violascens DSM 198]
MSEDYGVQSASIPANDIFAGDFPIQTQAITLAANQGALARGQVLGIKLSGAVAAKVSGTGDGNVAAASITLGPKALPGVYVLTCTAEAANAGTFKVRAPNGERLANLTVASAYATDQINLTVPDGANDWDIGDIVTVTVTGKAVAYAPTATDGSEKAALILADALTVGTSDLAAVAYRTGGFARAQLTGIDDAAVLALDARSIFVR